MRIGIDISQTAYEGTGVANPVKNLVESLVKEDQKNEYILFFASLRRKPPKLKLTSKAKLRHFRIAPSALDFLWNKVHMLPIESLIGKVDLFISSDWTEPPSKAKKVTFIHDLSVYKFPDETHAKIVSVQKRKLALSVKECDAFICPSIATKKDAVKILGIPKDKIHVVPWGI